MKSKGYILAAVSAVTYGMIPLFMLPIKAFHFSTNVALFYRFLIAALLLLGILVYKKEYLKIKKRDLGIIMVLGFFLVKFRFFNSKK